MVIDKARELGLALSQSAEFERMLITREAIENDSALTGLINVFNQKQHELAEILAAEDGIENGNLLEAASHDLDNMQRILLENPLFSDMLEAQNDFQKLMRRVNKVIGVCIGMTDNDDDTDSECNGSCGGCSGCTH